MSCVDPQRAPLLLIGASAADARALRQAVDRADGPPLVDADCLTLVRQVATLAPQVVICNWPQDPGDLLAALAPWAGAPPCPVIVIGPLPSAAAAAAFAEAGVSVCATGLDGAGLQAQQAFAAGHHRRLQALRAELAEARGQLEERKWIDRAKGLLMSARGIAEDDAFKLLRGAAMHANLKLAEVARSVLDAARWGEAVNRAGQLRMLSQRLVALAAQRLAKVEPARSRKLYTLAQQRARDNIEHLASLALEGGAADAFAQVGRQWAALEAALHVALAARADARSLLQADQRAEALLLSADRLTDELQAHGARRALSIVNLCGSQRMRAQRLAKDALLLRLLPDAARAGQVQATMTEFETVQRRIEAAPLSSAEIRSAQAAAQDNWLMWLRAWREADPVALAHASEALLQVLDQLTDHCEHSLQLLMS